ncbi:fimbria/pilus periplasmic chaperone [Pantoea allii]|uniref:fimbria/pilus periplasmic chaperone n=1 Tax=Pantoea allii TaxID=574096 RepID=UPI000A234411|nr:fimbria/pilus periplasmic chaperone [Pantoea allii]MBW1251823.1 fimbria/pilus periplasmic chaperone [Pantoea allii]MBW1260420.1 fimbria/pilus periplasmic chaperone [Pantoea allii]MBW1283017.1 fimbria/pilus periplasmic chaperone [Pantoea allii]ORM89033.1 fimbrial chaperone protein StbB [Pantoea allii]PBJ98850.1 fimbrial chaperone protein StbB [Pantoea allii]
MFIRRLLLALTLSLAVIPALTLPFYANASVTIMGSRIIYPGQARSVDVQFKNNDAIPYVIQSWFDNGDENSQPENRVNTPFIITPPVFRIQPKAGQVAKVMVNNTVAQPQDRESVYWFNTLQIPPSNINQDKTQNVMLVVLRNRMKVFYRPERIGAPKNILKGITVTPLYQANKGNGIEIDNPQPWHASLVDVVLKVGNHTFKSEADMVSPFAKQTYWFNNSKRLQGAGVVSISAVNDQGAKISENFTVDVN